MDDLKSLLEYAKDGIPVPFILWFLLDKKKEMDERREEDEKKRSGKYITWESMDSRIRVIENKIEEQSNKKGQEGNVIVAIQKDIQYHGEKIEKVEGDIKDVFHILSEMKNMMIEDRQNRK